ncbi:MAG: ATP-binding protein [Chloroflexi bacterium]|nr:ATP-binding protein [Chloroflexota bacterium]
MRTRFEEIRLAADLANLGAIDNFVTACCKRWHVNESDSFEIQLASDEAATNIIHHAYEEEEGVVTIRCWVRDGHDFCVELRDSGRPFDPDEIEAPDIKAPLEDRAIGGLGIHMMRKVMDEVSFESGDTGNRLLMVKRSAVP